MREYLKIDDTYSYYKDKTNNIHFIFHNSSMKNWACDLNILILWKYGNNSEIFCKQIACIKEQMIKVNWENEKMVDDFLDFFKYYVKNEYYSKFNKTNYSYDEIKTLFNTTIRKDKIVKLFAK